MKTSSRRRPFLLPVLLAGLAACASLRAADAETAGSVASPVKRQEVIDNAHKLLASREAAVVTNDPFHPAAFEELLAASVRPPGSSATPAPGDEAPAQPAGPRTDRDLLAAIGAGLRPSGYFVLGGQPTLLFGQKRVKAGGTMTITFEGAQYTLEITTITPPNFTLRLNREEFTRTIK